MHAGVYDCVRACECLLRPGSGVGARATAVPRDAMILVIRPCATGVVCGCASGARPRAHGVLLHMPGFVGIASPIYASRIFAWGGHLHGAAAAAP